MPERATGGTRNPGPRASGGGPASAPEGEEGTFTICSFWLVSALAQIGEVARARD